MLQSKIDAFNLLLKNHNDTSFLFTLLDPLFPINMTTTHAPIIDGANNLITLSFDGRIYDSASKANHGKLPSAIPERVVGDKANSQQLFVHESMLTSLFYAVSSKYFPFEFQNSNVTEMLGRFFSEIGDYYGPKSNTTLKFNLLASNDEFISINKSAGIEIGKNGKASLQLLIFCANETTPQELAVEFNMNLNAVVNASSDNYYIYLNIPYLYVSDVTIINDKVGMWARDYNMFLSSIMMTLVRDLNQEFSQPYDMRTIWPDFMMLIVNVFTLPRVSPFYYDGFLYLGMTYFMDPWSLTTVQEKRGIEERILKDRKSVV